MTTTPNKSVATPDGVDEHAIRRVHLLFKTHLDLGFTDLAGRIHELYMQTLIPKALQLAEDLRQTDGPERFRWTTGSWLVWQYLEQCKGKDRRRMEQAIERGDIVWHALPFTTHTELMDASLFRHGLSLSRRLDERFGRRTIAAKMTDVPGHTRAMVPLLAEAGVKFLHLGVNPASSGPSVPPVFRWRDAASDTEVVVNYHHRYGQTTLVPGLDDALAFVFTGDNKGPQSRDEVIEKFEQRRVRFPNATIEASTMDRFAEALWRQREHLPVIEDEIGDTWIHGVGTDPLKVARFKTLQRLRRRWVERDPGCAMRGDVDQFSQQLMLIAEHTWGLDEKENLGDVTTYGRADLKKARRRLPWKRFEASWAEQRDYIDAALAALKPARRAEAEHALAALKPHRLPRRKQNQQEVETARWQATVDPISGALTELRDRSTDRRWADAKHPLGLLGYQRFNEADYQRYIDRYLWRHPKWAVQDFTKPGMDRGGAVSDCSWPIEAQPHVNTVDGGMEIGVVARFADELTEFFGCPAEFVLRWTLPDQGDDLTLTVDWFDKPANRMAEAIWLSFVPRVAPVSGWWLQKLGSAIDPKQVARKGNRHLHAVESVIHRGGRDLFMLNPLDTPLVAPGRPGLLDFTQRYAALSEGMHVNLYNNIWGTNFPMWFEDDVRLRFCLRLKAN